MKRNVFVLATCQALMMSGNTIIITATALAGLVIAPAPIFATLPFALMFVGVILTTYPASMFMARAGRRTGFSIGAVTGITGASVSALGIAQNSFLLFCAGSVLLGSFNAFGQYYRFAAAEAVEPAHQSKAIAYVVAGGIVAAFVGPALARSTREAIGPEFAGNYACIAALYCITLMLVQTLKIAGISPQAAPESKTSIRSVFGNPVFRVAALSGAIGYGVMNMLMTATPLAMLEAGFHFDQTATVIQWHVVGMFAPALVTGHLISRLGVYPVMVFGTLCLLGSCLVGLAGSGFAHFLTALVLLGLGWNFCFIGATTLLARHTGPKGRIQGLNDLLIFSTVGVSALISGPLHYTLGWATVNLYTSAVVALTFLILIRVWWSPATPANAQR